MTAHLGDLAAAFVDGQLPAEVRDRAARHLAECARCRDEVAVQERLKTELSHLFAPAPPSDLAARLMRLGECSATDGGPGGGRPARPFRPAPRADRLTRPASRPTRHRARRVLFASASVIVLGAGGAFAVGGGGSGGGGGPRVTPQTPAYLVQHVSTTTFVPLSDPALTAASFPTGR